MAVVLFWNQVFGYNSHLATKTYRKNLQMASAGAVVSKTSRLFLQTSKHVFAKVFRFRNCREPVHVSLFSSVVTNQETKSFPDCQTFVVTQELQSRLDEQAYVRFGGEIHVVNTADEELCCDGVQHVLRGFQSAEALGFDAEFSVQKGVKICLVQLASASASVLWRVNNLSSRNDLPPGLTQLLTGDLLKVGHGSTNDAILILEHLGVNTGNVIDTFPWAVALNCQPRTLQAMCALFLNCRLSKKMARSNWDRMELSPRQVMYAATDAWLSLKVYMEMKRKAKELNIDLDEKASSAEELAEIIAVNQRESRRLKNKRARQQRSAKKKALRQERELQEQQKTAVADDERTTTTKDLSTKSENINEKVNQEITSFLSEERRSMNKELTFDFSQVSENKVENLTESDRYQDSEKESISPPKTNYEQCHHNSVLVDEDSHLESQNCVATDKRETARLRRLRYRRRKKEREMWCKVGILD